MEMRHERHTLSNGLTMIATPMAGVQSVAVSIFVGLGSRHESTKDAGAAHMLEHMLFKGTERRPRARDISDAVEAVGGVLNASTDKEVTVFWAKVARQHFRRAVDLLGDMLQHSRLAPPDLAREKAVVLEELRMLADDPQDWVHVLSDETLWPNQPLGREVAGASESVMRLRVRDLRRYLDAYYSPANTVISVAGGIDLETALPVVAEVFGEWNGPLPPSGEMAHFAEYGARSRIEYKPTEQANICVAYPGVPRNHPDRWPLEMLTMILGGGSSSRLFQRLRERRALAYDIHAASSNYDDTGAVVIFAGTEAGKAARLVEEVFRETERLRRRRVAAAELQQAQQAFSGRLWLGLEDTQAVAAWFGAQELLQHAAIGPAEVTRLIDEVTPDDVLRAARNYLAPEAARLAAVGPVLQLNLDTQLAGA